MSLLPSVPIRAQPDPTTVNRKHLPNFFFIDQKVDQIQMQSSDFYHYYYTDYLVVGLGCKGWVITGDPISLLLIP